MIEIAIFGIMLGLVFYELIYWEGLRLPDTYELYQRSSNLSEFFKNAYLGFPFPSKEDDYVRIEK